MRNCLTCGTEFWLTASQVAAPPALQKRYCKPECRDITAGYLSRLARLKLPSNALRQRLTNRMAADRLTAATVARATAINRGTIADWLAGRSRTMTRLNLSRLAAWLGLELSDAIRLSGGKTAEDLRVESARLGLARLPAMGSQRWLAALRKTHEKNRGSKRSPETRAKMSAAARTQRHRNQTQEALATWHRGARKDYQAVNLQLRALLGVTGRSVLKRISAVTISQLKAACVMASEPGGRTAIELYCAVVPSYYQPSSPKGGQRSDEREHLVAEEVLLHWPRTSAGGLKQGAFGKIAERLERPARDVPRLNDWWRRHKNECALTDHRLKK
ncbi:MAG: helix-turn-helix domain-containing protein [Candidatus Dormibacteraceae bacterium]